jgi:hypothetical protein
MTLFDQNDQIKMIGIGAYERSGLDRFAGPQRTREMVAGDWEY